MSLWDVSFPVEGNAFKAGIEAETEAEAIKIAMKAFKFADITDWGCAENYRNAADVSQYLRQGAFAEPHNPESLT